MRKKLTVIILMLLVIVGTIGGASVRITVDPQRGKRSIEVGDNFYINIEVDNANGEVSKPSSVGGGKVSYFEQTGSYSNTVIINGVGKQTVKSVYTVTCRATKEGSYSFGPIMVGGVKSNIAHYQIGATQSTADNGRSVDRSGGNVNGQDAADKPQYIGRGDGNLFMRANVSSTTAYEQQALVYTVKLYTTYDAIKFVGATSAPKFDGFVVEESKDVSSSMSLETYQGKTYATAIVARYIIFPQMTGNLKVSGNTYTIAVDRREYYHDSFFGSISYSTPLQLNVTPNDLVVNVKSLPTPKPTDFSGAVGKFKISSQLKGNVFKSNQAAAIVYSITGTGNIKYIQMPDLSALYPSEIEVYTPTNKQAVTVGSSNVSGTVTYDYSFMPLEEGEFKIPEVRLVYFNPESGKYETSVARGYNIHVEKGAAASGSKGKRHLKFDSELEPVSVTDLKAERTAYVKQFWYWLWYIIPVVILIVSMVAYRRYRDEHADMAALNSKRADKLARRRLKKAASAMRTNKREEFYDELLKALWGYLGDKLRMPTSELMRDNVRQVLGEHEIEGEAVDQFINLIDEAEFAKYSSVTEDGGLKRPYEEAIRVINQLEKSFKQ